MSDQDGLAWRCHRVKDTCSPVSRSRHELAASGIKPNIKNLVVVTSERLDALAGSHVPDLALPIDRTTDTNRTLVVELCARNFSVVASEGVHAASSPHVPDFDGMVKRACNYGSSGRVEVETYNLSCMALQYNSVALDFKCHYHTICEPNILGHLPS